MTLTELTAEKAKTGSQNDKQRKDLKAAYELAAEQHPIEYYKENLKKIEEEQAAIEEEIRQAEIKAAEAAAAAAATLKKTKKSKAKGDGENAEAGSESASKSKSKKRKAEDETSVSLLIRYRIVIILRQRWLTSAFCRPLRGRTRLKSPRSS